MIKRILLAIGLVGLVGAGGVGAQQSNVTNAVVIAALQAMGLFGDGYANGDVPVWVTTSSQYQPSSTAGITVSVVPSTCAAPKIREIGALTTGFAFTLTPSVLTCVGGTTVTTTTAAQFLVGVDGTAAAPSLGVGVAGTGWYRTATARLAGSVAGTAQAVIDSSTGFIATRSDGFLGFVSGTDLSANGLDTFFSREAAATIQLGADAAGAIDQILKGPDRITSDGVGGNLTFAGGRNRGASAGGSLIFQTSPAAGVGVPGTLATQLTITALGITSTVPILTADGTVGAPSYSFASAPTTGTFYNGSNGVRWTVAGTGVGDLWSGGIALASSTSLSWASSTIGATLDVSLSRRAAYNPLFASSTNAYRLDVANTYSSNISNEVFSVDWQTTANVARVGTFTAATGTARMMRLMTQGINGSANYSVINVDRSSSSGAFIGLYPVATATLGAASDSGATTDWVTIGGGVSTSTDTSGTVRFFTVKPVYNQASGNAANTDLLINRTQTLVGSGAQLLIDAQVSTVSKFSVSNTGVVVAAAGIGGGGVTPTGSLSAPGNGSINFVARAFMTSPADGMLNISDNAVAFGIQFNTGTAAPTLTSCGTGSVTTGSRNVAGEVTATGATACTVTFGAPNWTNTPFCVIEDETTAVAQRISAISATAFTVTGLTSGDKFMYHCIGRV